MPEERVLPDLEDPKIRSRLCWVDNPRKYISSLEPREEDAWF